MKKRWIFVLYIPIFLLASILNSKVIGSADQSKIPMTDMQQVFGHLKATVHMPKATNQVYVKRGPDTIIFQVGSATANHNGQYKKLQAPITLDETTKKPQISVRDIYPFFQNGQKNRAHTVVVGDSLQSIAEQHWTAVEHLKKWNRLKTDNLYAGQRLHVKSPYHIVKKGETLRAIADSWQTRVEAVMAVNGLQTQTVKPNQRLLMPLPVVSETPVEFAGAVFPLIKGSYSPYVDSYGAPRAFDSGATPRKHEGTDIFAKTGVPVFAAYDGTILFSGWNLRGGWRLSIQAGTSTTAFYYAHFVKYAPGIWQGATVKKGQLLGFVGATGYGPVGTTGKFPPHLHFGVYDITTEPWTARNAYPYLKRWE
jgi:murein DD-endopeptidase MepM/ murein hydrolase activator NlpD